MSPLMPQSAVVQAASSQGTAFPGSPTTGDLFWRTDLALQFYWDGTRWLSATLFDAPMGVGSTPPPLVNTGQAAAYFAPPTDLDSWLVAWRMTTYVSAPNDGTNYWSIQLEKRNAANVATPIDTFVTSADTVANWTDRTRALGVALGGAAAWPALSIVGTVVLAGGAMYYATALRFRLIGT